MKMRVRDAVKAHADRSKKFTCNLRWRLTAFPGELASQYIDTVNGAAVRERIGRRMHEGNSVTHRTKSSSLAILAGALVVSSGASMGRPCRQSAPAD